MLKVAVRKQIEQIFEPLTRDELNEVLEIWKRFADHRDRLDALTFEPGQTVSFRARGRIMTGKVKSIGQKNIKVDVDGILWRVHPSFFIKK